MLDLGKILADAENTASRLALQAKQEEALREVAPARYENNLSVFQKYMPGIAETFKNYKPVKEFRLFCSDNGIPNLEWLENHVAIYGDDPYSECKQQIQGILRSDIVLRLNYGKESNPLGFIHVDYLNKLTECNERAAEHLTPISKIPESIPLAVMFGCGLGYQLGYLYEECLVGNLFIFEPDLDLFYASLYCFDWASLLEHLHEKNLGIHIFLGQDEKSVMNDFICAIHKRGAFLAVNALLSWHYPSPEIFRLIEQVKKEFYLIAMGWGFYDDNIIALSHCAENLNNKIPFLLNEKFINQRWSSTPVFVLANGPSLDGSLDLIRRYENHAILVSCGSTISALHKAGIKPDIHVETERTKAVPDFLGMLEDDEYLKDILFLSTDVIHPECMKYFEHAGLCFKFDEPSAMLCSLHFPESRERAHLIGTNPLVANIGLKMVCALGFKQVYLFGVDNGYKDRSHHHSRLSSYFDKDGKAVEQLTDIVIGSSSYLVPANFGGEVSTTAMFDSSRRVLGSIITDHPSATVYNCSDGAFIENTKPLRPEMILIDETSYLNKKTLLNHIYSDLFTPLDIDRQAMKEHLDVPFFNELMDRLISEWSQVFSSRVQVSELMQKQYDYMSIIANSYHRHIYKMLVGTLNYAFTLVSVSLYRFEDEDKTLEVIRELGDIVKDYFTTAKNMYPQALDSIDMVDNSIMNLFRSSK